MYVCVGHLTFLVVTCLLHFLHLIYVLVSLVRLLCSRVILMVFSWYCSFSHSSCSLVHFLVQHF